VSCYRGSPSTSQAEKEHGIVPIALPPGQQQLPPRTKTFAAPWNDSRKDVRKKSREHTFESGIAEEVLERDAASTTRSHSLRMGVVKTIAIVVLSISLAVFVALFGRLPVFR
jgi:hypothetical protein